MRLRLNMQRLGEEKYQPDHVFLTMQQSGEWPGDTEGRTILGLTLDAQALHSASPNLEEILRRLPSHLNERGYMGLVFPDIIHEQQLSGNGWMLRGLCEYYEWRGDSAVLSVIRTMARNLFLPWKGHYATYPVRPEDRKQNVGAASGETVGQIGRWQLSSDVGCLFIGMDGLIHAYAVTHDEELRPVIDELVECFLGIDLLAIKAQTHATLTALRGLMRYAAITGERRLVDAMTRGPSPAPSWTAICWPCSCGNRRATWPIWSGPSRFTSTPCATDSGATAASAPTPAPARAAPRPA